MRATRTASWLVTSAAAVQTGGGPNARGSQKVLIGPWSHSDIGKLQQGELTYPAAEGESSLRAKEFFDFYLRGAANGYGARPTFRYFRINDNAWVDAAAWPPPGAQALPFYLTESRELSPLPPASAIASVTYTSDPSNPVPTLFGAILVEGAATQGPGDLTPIDGRPEGGGCDPGGRPPSHRRGVVELRPVRREHAGWLVALRRPRRARHPGRRWRTTSYSATATAVDTLSERILVSAIGMQTIRSGWRARTSSGRPPLSRPKTSTTSCGNDTSHSSCGASAEKK